VSGAPLLTIVIPARNEEGSIVETLDGITSTLNRERVPREIVVVNDGSSDATAALILAYGERDPSVRLVENHGRHGFGMAIRKGLEAATGEIVAVMMADLSDSPDDLVRYYITLRDSEYDCVFGSRFIRGSKIIDYPPHKLVMNRMANFFIRMLFALRYNDITNAFKCYRREVIESMYPIISPHFNLTVEMPLKAIVRGYSFKVIPISWTNRKHGVSKLKIKEMGSRYLFIVLYLWLEKFLSRGDYHRRSMKTEETRELAKHPNA
jgi:dolichol-phosphate mannosyltransferase